MASSSTLLKRLLNVNDLVVNDFSFERSDEGVLRLDIDVRPHKRHCDRCPVCGRHSQGYDHVSTEARTWRSLDFGGILVYLHYQTQRIRCSEHGVVTASTPWSFTGSRFTKEFDLTVAWMARHLPRSVVCEAMRIDWKTVGRCISRAKNHLEPHPEKRFDGLVRIGIDETSYRKGHKYITVVINHDTNTVVWAAQGYGSQVLSQFFEQLSDEQRQSIKTVTGDGARWIDACIRQYIPHAQRCVDPFHVVQWATESLDKLRRDLWREALKEQKQAIKAIEKTQKANRRPLADDINVFKLQKSKTESRDYQWAKYALGKAPENLTATQKLNLELVKQCHPKLFRAYELKERLRLILKMDDVEQARSELKRWFWRATHSRLPVMAELAKKIRRHEDNILNAICYKMTNARIEATNNKIKLVIRKAYGFRNIQNLLDMVLLTCSNIEIPLPNRATLVQSV